MHDKTLTISPLPDAETEAPSTKLRALFHADQTDELAIAAFKAGRDHQIGPHPLAEILPDAVATNRRADLLHTVDRILGEVPGELRLLELRATLLAQMGRLDEAEIAIRRSLIGRPKHRPALTLLVSTLTQAGRFDEAIAILERELDERPDDSTVCTNLAVLFTAQDRFAEALTLYRRAIMKSPAHAQIRLNYSITLLKAGHFAQGWTEHEWRLKLPGHSQLPHDTLLPNITPSLNLRDKRVLVTQEEGLGDTLMYLRFLPPLAERGARITVWGSEILARLTQRVEGVDIVQVGGERPEFDYHCPFISLPRAFMATPTPFGAAIPYLRADPEKSAWWKNRLKDDRKLRVGLVWGGAPRPDNAEAHMLDQRRSIPLAKLAMLRRLEGVTLYSLQKGPASEQLANDPEHIVDFTSDLHDMDDTAALINNLDIVVSVDTSVVHLAGGMGKRVLMMDRVNACWRWLHDRTDSPWYPNLTIVRQSRPWDWSDVVERVARMLEQAARSRVQ